LSGNEKTVITGRRCAMPDDFVSKDTCEKCFQGTVNQLTNIEGDVGEIKDMLGEFAGLASRMSVLEAYKKDSNRRMVISLGIVTLLFSIITNMDKIVALINGATK